MAVAKAAAICDVCEVCAGDAMGEGDVLQHSSLHPGAHCTPVQDGGHTAVALAAWAIPNGFVATGLFNKLTGIFFFGISDTVTGGSLGYTSVPPEGIVCVTPHGGGDGGETWKGGGGGGT